MKSRHRVLPVVGWREWVALPELQVPAIKAKIDTGARTSSLHAFQIETYREQGREMVRFEIHPHQRSSEANIVTTAPLLGYRSVRSSSGHATDRPVIRTTIELLGASWEIELTLANRDQMGFRMLLGREALKGRLLVDPGASYRDRSRRQDRTGR